ncbi:MAG: hypothetical protein ACKVHE_30290, partial [Planctomycetales bacterium]
VSAASVSIRGVSEFRLSSENSLSNVLLKKDSNLGRRVPLALPVRIFLQTPIPKGTGKGSGALLQRAGNGLSFDYSYARPNVNFCRAAQPSCGWMLKTQGV